MKYKGIEFDAIVATPCCGKSYLCDKYPNEFIDVDELRLRCKYYVPENITREELERTKGERPFERRASYEDYSKEVHKKMKEAVASGKVLICAPHPETTDFLVENGIRFCFIHPNKNMKQEILERFQNRNNPETTTKENDDMFYEFYEKNVNENQSVVHYEFGKGEYLEDIMLKFGYDFKGGKNNVS